MGKRLPKIGISIISGFGLSALSKDERDFIHFTTLQVLPQSGIKVARGAAREVLWRPGSASLPEGAADTIREIAGEAEAGMRRRAAG